MIKIAMIGAGGTVFPLRLVGDLITFPALRDSTISLMDVDLVRAERTAAHARSLIKHYGFPTRIEVTTDQRAALRGAKAVIVTFQVGGVEAYRHDVEIPRRYGLDQPVGDTLGPGGVFRFLRSATAFAAIAADMRELCPGAVLINYANPMAMNCWLLSRLGINVVGLCHSVQGTSRMLARHLDIPYEDIQFTCGGINHQAWFLEFRRGDEDLYPRLREVMTRTHLPNRDAAHIAGMDEDHGDHSGVDRTASNYEGAIERVRTEIMAAFGYFHTESSHHASEYLPYFRKNPTTVDTFIQKRWDYYEISVARQNGDREREMLATLMAELAPSVEYGALIIDSLVTGTPRVIHGNVPNHGLIPNLPEGCCVEVPCLIDANGVLPTAFGPIPPQCAALNRTNINVQELAVDAFLTKNRDRIHQAVMLDPLTGALLTLDQIRHMVDDLIEAEAAWLPDFATRNKIKSVAICV